MVEKEVNRRGIDEPLEEGSLEGALSRLPTAETSESAHSFLISPIEELLELNRGSFLYREIEEGLKEYIEGDSTHEEMVEEFKKKGLDEVEANILAYYVEYKRAEGREDENEMKRIEGELAEYYGKKVESGEAEKERLIGGKWQVYLL